VGLVSIDGDGSWRSKVEVEVDGGVGWAILGNKKSEKNITITTASGFEPRTLNPLVLCGRYPDELPLLRLPLISHFMLLAFAVYIRKHSGRLGK
jgi:hypothetical protein